MKNEIFISQRQYIENTIKKFNLLECKAIDTPLIANEELKKIRWS